MRLQLSLCLLIVLVVLGCRLESKESYQAWTLELEREIVHDKIWHVVGVTRLRNSDTVIVSSRGNLQVLVFDSSGFSHAIGGRGQGPGGFENLGLVWHLNGDTLLAYDLMGDVSFFTVGGDYLYEVSVPPSRPLGLLEDRTILARAGRGDVVRYNLQGEIVSSVGLQYPRPNLVQVDDPDPTVRSRRVRPYFAPSPSHAVGSDHYWLGSGNDYKVTKYDRVGNLISELEWDGPDLTVTKRHVSRLLEWLRDKGNRDYPASDKLPAYTQLVVDSQDNLWVRTFHPPYDPSPTQWLVFDGDEQMSIVETPRKFVIHEVGDDYVLGVYWDELDVERVRLYNLNKNDG